MTGGTEVLPLADALRPRAPDGMGRGAALSLLAHGLLLAALALGLSWRSRTPQAFSAELWSAVPQVAAPRAEPAPAPPLPQPAAPAPRPAPPAAEATPRPDAQIAIEKALEEKRQREKAERDRAEKARIEQEKAERNKAERDKAEKARAERAKAEQAKAEREKAERDAKAQAAVEQARLDKQRQENLKRMMGQAGVVGATGAPGSTGSALRDAAPSASYAGKLIARVKPNIVLTDPISGKPEAVVEVRAAPSGTIFSRRLVTSSGNPAWDDAVLRAIDRTGELPRDVDGRVPPVVLISFTP